MQDEIWNGAAPDRFESDAAVMRRAIELARRGRGEVEPNPMVGAVLVDAERRWIAEGWHRAYGGPHAEIDALRAAGSASRGATLFVTLEPCCHHGKTGPCTQAVIGAGVGRVVIGTRDPFPQVDGDGMAELSRAGIVVETGPLADEAEALIAPFRMLVKNGRPWVHAKWAMTLDGKIATRTGESRWISNAVSRARVHRLRRDMDAIVVGAGTARRDDPLLTTRLEPGCADRIGGRVAVRVVMDSTARLGLDSRLVQTAREVPVMVAASVSALNDRATRERADALRRAGVEVLELEGDGPISDTSRPGVAALLRELGRRRLTHVLVEGGGELHGAFRDLGLIDEVHVFVSPRLMGGAAAPSPIGGLGERQPSDMPRLVDPVVELLDGDIHIHGRVDRCSR